MYFDLVSNPLKMLKSPRIFAEFYIRNFIKVSRLKLMKQPPAQPRKSGKAVGRRLLCNDDYNAFLKERILDDAPFFGCRYGATELTTCFISQLYNKGIINRIDDKELKKAKKSSGVFPETEEAYLTFAEHYTEALKSADANAYWGSLLMEEYMINQFVPKDAVLYKMRALEPFFYAEPWTAALAGKRVLVVHPFAELITSQYANREKLFPGKNILPEFELLTVKAVQSSGETIPTDYESWVQALDGMWEQCAAPEYDVALLACGSYAVPLAARMKQAGKKAIVLGGMMQLMFGIKGARWEQSRPDIVALYNDSWVRATQYKVKDADKMVDGPAYW